MELDSTGGQVATSVVVVSTTERLRALHRPGNPVLLPNAWDAASALAVERAGFPAVATSSAAVAEALGYADHQQAPVAEMFDAVRRITRVVSVPVTMDAEGGYGMSGSELAERLADAGAVGCNFEDTDHAGGGIVDVSRQADRVAELRAAAPDLVINARVDVFLYAPDQKSVLDEGSNGRGRTGPPAPTASTRSWPTPPRCCRRS
ncbi:hypothetical protein GCM10029964_039610 [Kibdelosporangium lantanae]